ncbi:nucleotide-binding protein [Paenibacillus marinisediminis]
MIHGMKQDWILALPDKRLAERFSDYWRNGSYADHVQLRVFSQIDTLQHYSRLNPDAHVFMVSKEWEAVLNDSSESWFAGAKRIYLTDVEVYEENHVCIFQPLAQLFEQLWKIGSAELSAASALTAASFKQGAKVLTVCSAGGGSGKTTISFQLARYAAANGLRVFYWNVGLYPEWTLLYPEGAHIPRASNSFSQLLYYLRRDAGGKRDIPLDSFTVPVTSLRAETFDPYIRAEEWSEFSERELKAVIEWLMGTKRYDLILIDASDGCPFLDAAIKISHDVVWLILDDLPHLNKTVHCWNRIKRENSIPYSAFCSRTHLLVNRYMGAIQNRWCRLDLGISGFLPYIPQWKQFHRAEQWFGSAVFQAAFEEWAAAELPWLGNGRLHERAV